MSRQAGGARGNGGAVARGASLAAAKGAGLVGLAVLLGIVLLQVVDDGSDGPVATTDTTEATTPSTDDDGGGDGDGTTTTTAGALKTPDQLTLIVLNGGAPTGSARTMSDTLKTAGYATQLEPADWAGREEAGNAVLCKAGLEREATALAVHVGEGTTTGAFPDPAPTGAADADCIVAVGAPA